MSDIKRMKVYLNEAETFVDSVYQFAAEEKDSSAAYALRKNMNQIALILSESRELLNSMEDNNA